MKKLISIAAAILITAGVFAQGAKTESKGAKSATKYCCTACDQSSAKGGKCSHHKTVLVKEGLYYCPMHSEATSETAGKCPKCGMAMLKMEMETTEMYACATCDWSIPPVKGKCPNVAETVNKEGTLYCVLTHEKWGKCPKCGKDMEKVEVRTKKKAHKHEHDHNHDGHDHNHQH